MDAGARVAPLLATARAATPRSKHLYLITLWRFFDFGFASAQNDNKKKAPLFCPAALFNVMCHPARTFFIVQARHEALCAEVAPICHVAPREASIVNKARHEREARSSVVEASLPYYIVEIFRLRLRSATSPMARAPLRVGQNDNKKKAPLFYHTAIRSNVMLSRAPASNGRGRSCRPVACNGTSGNAAK